MRRATIALAIVSVSALALALFGLSRADTADATIHEIVASHCAKDHRGNVDPPGQTPMGGSLDQSDLRALFATGVYDETTLQFDMMPSVEGPMLPDGLTLWFGPLAAAEGALTVVPADVDQPSSKFSWDGNSWVGPILFEGLMLFVPAIEPDHASLMNCHNLQDGHP